MHLVSKETHAIEVVTKRFAFRATGEAFAFLERNPWFTRWLFLAYTLWLFRKPLRLLLGWAIIHLPSHERASRLSRTRTGAGRPRRS